MHRFLVFIWIIVLFIKNASFAQCKDSSYVWSNDLQNGYIRTGQQVNTIDEGTLTVFHYRLNNFESDGIVKHSKTGQLEWNKILKPANEKELFSPCDFMQLRNGKYMVGGFVSYPAKEALPYFILLQMDNNGNILWQHKYRNNTDVDTTLSNLIVEIIEGKDDELIVHFAVNSELYIAGFTAKGNLKWSNRYRGIGSSFFGQNLAASYNKDTVDFWGISQIKKTCFEDADAGGLTNFKIDYNTGDHLAAKRYCIATGGDRIPYSYRYQNPMSSCRTDNGNTVVFMHGEYSTNKLFIGKFDKYNNNTKTILFEPNQAWTKDTTFNYTYDVNKATGEIAISISIGNNLYPYGLLPYNYLLYLDSNLRLKRELLIKNTPAVPLTTFLKFKQANVLSTLFDHGYSGLNNSNFIIANTQLDLNTAGSCFFSDTLYGKFKDCPLVPADNDFAWDEVLKNIYTQMGDAGLVSSSLPIQQTLTCKKISNCDTLKIHGQKDICLGSEVFTFSVYKNPQCYKNIQWVADTNFVSIQQQRNDTLLQVKFKRSGSFKLYATLQGCTLQDSIEIVVAKPMQAFTISKENRLCPGNSLLLHATPGFKKYSWQNGSTASALSVTQPGLYKITATDSCGQLFKDSIMVRTIDTAFVLPTRQSLCVTDTLYVQIPTGALSVNWQPATAANLQGKKLSLYPLQDTRYKIFLGFGADCAVKKEIDIDAVICPETVFFPNSFTPNGDGINDFFKPSISRALQLYRLSVYNRWGQKIFETNDVARGWDGKLKGIVQNTGVYVWECMYQFKRRTVRNLKGSCMIIR